MIERSIENGAVAWRVELGTNASQFLVPPILCLGADGSEVLLVLFYLQISQGTSLADRRNGNLRLYYCTGVYLEYGLAIACIDAVHDKFLDRAVKSQCIIHNVVGPATAGTITHQSEHVLSPDACLGNTVAYTAFQVKHHIGITVSLGEGKLVYGSTVGSSHLCLNGPLVQKNTIIARFHNLLLVCISGRNVVDKVLARLCACIAIDGHQGYIAQVAATCTAEVGVRKTDNAVARNMITATPVPTMIRLNRTNIDHTPRHVCTNKHMTMSTTAYHGIHTVCILGRSVVCNRQYKCRQGKKNFFHPISINFSYFRLQRYNL